MLDFSLFSFFFLLKSSARFEPFQLCSLAIISRGFKNVLKGKLLNYTERERKREAGWCSTFNPVFHNLIFFLDR